MSNPIINVILAGVAAAMGVVVLVLDAMGSLDIHAAVSMLAIGLVCVGIRMLSDVNQ